MEARRSPASTANCGSSTGGMARATSLRLREPSVSYPRVTTESRSTSPVSRSFPAFPGHSGEHLKSLHVEGYRGTRKCRKRQVGPYGRWRPAEWCSHLGQRSGWLVIGRPGRSCALLREPVRVPRAARPRGAERNPAAACEAAKVDRLHHLAVTWRDATLRPNIPTAGLRQLPRRIDPGSLSTRKPTRKLGPHIPPLRWPRCCILSAVRSLPVACES